MNNPILHILHSTCRITYSTLHILHRYSTRRIHSTFYFAISVLIIPVHGEIDTTPIRTSIQVLRPVHTCAVCHAVKITCGQIEHIEINYDAHTNVVRPHTGRMHAVRFTQANPTAYGLPVQHFF